MPTDTLAEEVQSALKSAGQALRTNRLDDDRRRHLIASLTNLDKRLEADITERETSFVNELQIKEDTEIDARWTELNNNQRYVRANAEQKAREQTFQELRQVNGGLS